MRVLQLIKKSIFLKKDKFPIIHRHSIALSTLIQLQNDLLCLSLTSVAPSKLSTIKLLKILKLWEIQCFGKDKTLKSQHQFPNYIETTFMLKRNMIMKNMVTLTILTAVQSLETGLELQWRPLNQSHQSRILTSNSALIFSWFLMKTPIGQLLLRKIVTMN